MIKLFLLFVVLVSLTNHAQVNVGSPKFSNSISYDPFKEQNVAKQRPCIKQGYCGNAIPFKNEKEFKAFLEKFPDPIFFRRDPPALPINGQPIALASQARPPTANQAQPSAPSATRDFSKTNNQVNNVDEADIIKTDGKFIYTISRNKVSIIKAFPYVDAGIVSVIDFQNDYPIDLFIEGRFLAVMGVKYSDIKSNVFCKVYDLIYPKYPFQLHNYQFEGYYFKGRKTNGFVYLISTFSNYFRPKELPTYTVDKKQFTVNPKSIFYYPDQYNNPSFVSIFAFNLAKPYSNKVNIITILTQYSHELYMSQSNIYLINQNYFFSGQETQIHKIYFNGYDLIPFADGKVPGYIINQFSMDQSNGIFRIATTTFNSVSSSGVYALSSQLVQIGRLEGLAPTETIFSTRFVGNRLYMVTFRQIDPFFVIDLTNPAQISVLGILKIPGFSRYLHPYDANTIIGLGRQATPDGRQLGLKISLFNVLDVTNPIQIASYQFEQRWSSSTAEWQHRAFLFSKEKQLLVIPGYYDNFVSNDRFNGAFVFQITSTSISLRGRVDHTNGNADSNIFYSRFVDRSLYIEDLLYTKSECLVKINRLADLVSLKDINLPCDPPVPIGPIIDPAPRPLPVQVIAVANNPN